MFESHKLNESGAQKVARFKRAMDYTMGNVLAIIPEGREKSIFKTKMEEGVMFAVKAIAADPSNNDGIIEHFTKVEGEQNESK